MSKHLKNHDLDALHSPVMSPPIRLLQSRVTRVSLWIAYLYVTIELMGGCAHQLDFDLETSCELDAPDPASRFKIINEETEDIAGQWRLEVNLEVHYCAAPHLGDQLLSAPLVFDTYEGKIWWSLTSRRGLNRELPIGEWAVNAPFILELPLNSEGDAPSDARQVNLIVSEASSERLIQGEARVYVRQDGDLLTLAHLGAFTLTRF